MSSKQATAMMVVGVVMFVAGIILFFTGGRGALAFIPSGGLLMVVGVRKRRKAAGG